MKIELFKQTKPAMTLVELLVLIALIGILAALILPALAPRHPSARRAVARFEMASFAAAISQYQACYQRLAIADSDTNSDITFGITPADIQGFRKLVDTRLVAANSDLLLILMDIDQGVNAGHKLNPQKHVFLSPKMVADPKQHGVSITDYQYRDPWGNPYIISLDANHDDHVRDACYASAISSLNPASLALTNRGGFFELDGNVMIWSRGPDGKASMTSPANTGVNKDNVLSWR